jgi:ATP-dependent DNA helicase DinG
MMIASLAATAVSKGQSVVISAPLSVTWQLIEDLARIPEVLASGVALLLGRVNFVSPVLLREWAIELEQQELLEWIDAGGQPRSEKTINASKVLGVELNWLLEDAMQITDDIPIASVSLAAESGDDEDCSAEQVDNKALRGWGDEVGIQLCSHHLLASRIQQTIL